ncbi:MAG: arylamine N-acetyltransferase [Chlorobaculum sp.]|nr:arylamine N-acetyltransferase [Chlorobaculum sp.]
MKATNFDLPSYLARIGFNGEASPDFDTLKHLMRCQLFSVPFENLDVQAGKVPSLAPEAIYTKIVERRRGGYCYEVNGLFAMALEAVGIPYRFVAARPMTYAVRRPKTHVAIIASIDRDEWLCDLGFGGYGIREPLNLRWLDREIRQDYDAFRLTMASERDYLLQSLVDNEWKKLYEFNLCPQEWVDFEPANWLNATHPDSIFVQGLIVAMQHPDGKAVLSGDRFRYVSKGRVEERIVGQDDVTELLRQCFSLG